MINRLYVMTASDTIATGAIEHLLAQGAECLILGDNEFYRPGVDKTHEVVLLFVSESGRYPSKCLRILPSIRYAEEHGFTLPRFVTSVGKAWPVMLVAIRPRHTILQGNFSEAMRQLHNRDREGRWVGAKLKQASRRHLLRQRREERRLEHLPM